MQGRQQGSAHIAVHMLPVSSSSSQFHQPVWDPAQTDAMLPSSMPGVLSTELGTSAAQSTFLPALMLQRHQAQGLPSHSLQQAMPSSGSAMRQLALSTAATTDLLAGMAANSSHAHPDSALHLIQAATATLHAFARAAQGPVGGQQPGNNSALMLSSSAVGPGQLPELHSQQLSGLQQQWQLQQQQLQQMPQQQQPQQQGWNGSAQLFTPQMNHSLG